MYFCTTCRQWLGFSALLRRKQRARTNYNAAGYCGTFLGDSLSSTVRCSPFQTGHLLLSASSFIAIYIATVQSVVYGRSHGIWSLPIESRLPTTLHCSDIRNCLWAMQRRLRVQLRDPVISKFKYSVRLRCHKVWHTSAIFVYTDCGRQLRWINRTFNYSKQAVCRTRC